MNEAAPDEQPILFCDRGCPFAHRVLSMLGYLGRPFDRREAPVGSKPDGLTRYSASERLPTLVHRGLVLTESRVMLDYLAELYDFADAYPADLATRTLHRHAMAVVDDYLVPILMGRSTEPGARRLLDTLSAIEAATATTPPRPTLLALHLGPTWNAFRNWQPRGAVTRAIRARPALHEWLERATELPCVARAAADPATLADDLKRAREAGLLPNAV